MTHPHIPPPLARRTVVDETKKLFGDHERCALGRWIAEHTSGDACLISSCTCLPSEDMQWLEKSHTSFHALAAVVFHHLCDGDKHLARRMLRIPDGELAVTSAHLQKFLLTH
jgi:hypothetical protein